MPRPRKAANTLDLRRFAFIGAQARLAEITAESEKILSFFPELRGSRNSAAARNSSASPSPRPRRRRTKMFCTARVSWLSSPFISPSAESGSSIFGTTPLFMSRRATSANA
jgi:hypothetical protein